MPVIAMVGNKGGAGKTTLAVNLASALARRSNTAVMDADPQGSTLQWRAFSEDNFSEDNQGLSVVEANADLEQQARTLSPQYDFLVIDCPSSVHAPQTHAALRVSDVALIPVQPSPVDLWATVHIERAVEQARDSNPGLQAILVINQLEPRTTLSRLVREALAEIDLPLAQIAVRRRAVYRASALEGKSVYDMGKRGSDAAAELNQLIEEVIPL
jgi:chromosome partitioning protein